MDGDAAHRVRAVDACFLPLQRFETLCAVCLQAAQSAVGTDLRGAMVHGSALPAERDGKGGFIDGFSDFDFHIYLAPERMRTAVECALDTALALQERFAAVQTAAAPTPVQLFCVSAAGLPRGWSLPPGSHRAVHGSVPSAHPDDGAPLARAISRLRACRREVDAVARSLCDKGDAGLRGVVRNCASMFKGVLPHAALAGRVARPRADGRADADPASDEAEVWLWPVSRLVLQVAPAAGVGEEALLFWDGLTRWPRVRESPAEMHAMIKAAATALDRLAAWADGLDLSAGAGSGGT